MSANVMIIFGTRPEYLKLWPVYRGLYARGLTPVVICTQQHDALVRQQFQAFDMPVDHWLGVTPTSDGGLNPMLSQAIERVDRLLCALKPRLTIVQGDTTSALAGAMAAFHREIPVAHVEAGLRSGQRGHPWPEEWNRVAIDTLSTCLYAPTPQAAEQARASNPSGHVVMVGNTSIDSVMDAMDDLPPGAGPSPVCYVLLDLHRRESFGPCMAAMVRATLRAAAAHDVRVFWLVHPNPAVQDMAMSIEHPCLTQMAPLPYHAFIALARQAQLILTDSGGLCEEAIQFGVPTLQLRDYTDRPEAIAAGCSWLAGRRPADIEKLTMDALTMTETWKTAIRRRQNPYGGGDAGEKIAQSIQEWLTHG